MKKIGKSLIVVCALGIGAFVARGSETREIQATAMERAAMDKLQRSGAELEDVRKRWEDAAKAHRAETAAIMSELRVTYKMRDGEDFLAYDQAKGIFTVGTAPAVGTK